jgi:hypothetical protein
MKSSFLLTDHTDNGILISSQRIPSNALQLTCLNHMSDKTSFLSYSVTLTGI